MLKEVEKRHFEPYPQKPEFRVGIPYEIEATHLNISNQIIQLIEVREQKNFGEMKYILEKVIEKGDNPKLQKIALPVWQSENALSSLLIRIFHPSTNNTDAIETLTGLLTGEYEPIKILPKVARTVNIEHNWNLLNTLAEWREAVKFCDPIGNRTQVSRMRT